MEGLEHMYHEYGRENVHVTEKLRSQNGGRAPLRLTTGDVLVVEPGGTQKMVLPGSQDIWQDLEAAST